MIENLTENITDLEYQIMKEFFPGPLTIILKKKKIVPDILTANTDTIGIRMPDSTIARTLIKLANVPIAAPSANITGHPSGTNIQTIYNEFQENVNFYVDGGQSKLGIGSTILKIENETPYILREGSISREEIINCILKNKKI